MVIGLGLLAVASAAREVDPPPFVLTAGAARIRYETERWRADETIFRSRPDGWDDGRRRYRRERDQWYCPQTGQRWSPRTGDGWWMIGPRGQARIVRTSNGWRIEPHPGAPLRYNGRSSGVLRRVPDDPRATFFGDRAPPKR